MRVCRGVRECRGRKRTKGAATECYTHGTFSHELGRQGPVHAHSDSDNLASCERGAEDKRRRVRRLQRREARAILTLT